jgi:hypothetical protein
MVLPAFKDFFGGGLRGGEGGDEGEAARNALNARSPCGDHRPQGRPRMHLRSITHSAAAALLAGAAACSDSEIPTVRRPLDAAPADLFPDGAVDERDPFWIPSGLPACPDTRPRCALSTGACGTDPSTGRPNGSCQGMTYPCDDGRERVAVCNGDAGLCACMVVGGNAASGCACPIGARGDDRLCGSDPRICCWELP